MDKKQLEVLEKAIEKYGKDRQLMICAEECAELIQAISKIQRYSNDFKSREHLIEEMADVLICLQYLVIINDVTKPDIDEYITSKIERLEQRLERE